MVVGGCVEGEERRARTRERLHSKTAISRDEAFLNKHTEEKAINTVFVHQAESSLCRWSIYFSAPIVFLLVSDV